MSDTKTSAAEGSAGAAAENRDASSNKTDRDNRGRFAKGNPGGKGNPFARRTAAMRQALMDAVSEEDIAVICKKMVEKAREGDVAAARLVLAYVVGKPQAVEDPDRLDEKEWQQYVRETVEHGDLKGVIGGMSASLACTIAGAAVPGMQAAAQESLLDRIQAMDEEQLADRDEEFEEDQDPQPGEKEAERVPTQPARASREGGQGGGDPAALEAAAAMVAALLRGGVNNPGEAARRAANRKET